MVVQMKETKKKWQDLKERLKKKKINREKISILNIIMFR